MLQLQRLCGADLPVVDPRRNFLLGFDQIERCPDDGRSSWTGLELGSTRARISLATPPSIVPRFTPSARQ